MRTSTATGFSVSALARDRIQHHLIEADKRPMKTIRCVVLGLLGLLVVSFCSLAGPVGTTNPDEEAALQAFGLPVDDPSLLEFLHLRSLASVPDERLTALIQQLGSDKAPVRERACLELIALGPLAVPLLRQVSKDPDMTQPAGLAQRCLLAIESSASLTGSVLRLLAERRPPQTVETVLAFLPFADEEGVLEETRRVLSLLGVQDGKLHPALFKALESSKPVCRVLALDVLCQLNQVASRPLLRKFLRDPQASVRLRTSLALARLGEGDCLPVLINLLEELPVEQGRQVEEFLTDLAGDHAPKVTLEAEAETRKKCRDAWMAWWETPPANLTNDALIQELHRRTLKEENRPKVKAAITLLGEEDFAVREKGSADLKALGEVALPELRVAATGTDPEIARRAKELLDEFEKDHLPALPSSALRLLTLRRPAGLVEAILGYLPFTEDESARADAQLTLNNLAALQEHADPVLLRHLEDRSPLRRAAVAQALLHCADVHPRPAIRKLLADPEVAVRVQVGLALAAQRDKEAIPVLISALADATEHQSNEIEEYLRWLSGDHGPGELPPNAKGNRRRDHWAAWWEANARLVNLPEKPLVLPAQTLGYTLLISYNSNQICEVDAKGKTRWTMNNVGNPMDAEVLPGDRVLVSEFAANRVTERNLKGEVLWQRAVNGNPISAQRLSNGNTFIVTRNQLLEVDRAGREVVKIDRPQMDVFSARRLNDGKIMVLSNTAQYQRLDRKGKQLSSCMIPNGLTQYANEILPSGNVLIPMTWQNQVMEYTSEGKLVNTFNVQMPSCACRLPKGNTLVGMQNVFPARVVELDAKGKQVGELKHNDNNMNNMMVTRIHRR